MIVGFVFKKYPPQKMNFIYGYRSSKSLKNQAQWDYAQKIAASESIKLGGVLTVSSMIGLYYKPSEHLALIIGLGFMIITFLILIMRVEKAITTKFKDEK